MVSLAIVTSTLISAAVLVSAFVAAVTARTFEVDLVVVVEVVGLAEIDTRVLPAVAVVVVLILVTDSGDGSS